MRYPITWGNVQISFGQKSGIKHAIHALRRRFLEDRTERIPLIDARNAFYSLNRNLALKNIKKLSSSIYTRSKTRIRPHQTSSLIKKIISHEGTTQGDPIAMAINGVATFLLIDMLEDQNLTHKGYADDGNVAGSLESPRIVLDDLYEYGGPLVIMCSNIIILQNLNLFRSRTKSFWD